MASVEKKVTHLTLKWNRHVKRRNEGHVLRRRMGDHYQEKYGEEDKQPDGKNCLMRIGKVWAVGEGRIGQDKVEGRNQKLPAISDDEKCPRKRRTYK